MRKIWKYALTGHGITTIEVPGSGKVLHVGAQKDAIFAWVSVSGKKGESMVDIKLHTYYTNEDIDMGNLSYIGTVVRNNWQGDLVTHVFQEK